MTEQKQGFPKTFGTDLPKIPETDEERKERTGLSSLEISDREAAAVQKTENRVTLESIKAKVSDIEYFRPIGGTMTICILTLENGYQVVGKSATADKENFNYGLGQKFAYEDALRQIWPLEAYLLKERMASD